MKKIASVSLCALLLVAGCAGQKFSINEGSNANQTVNDSTFFVAGLGQEDIINAATMCKGANKVVSVEVKETPINILLRVVTLAIYTPRSYTVTCKS